MRPIDIFMTSWKRPDMTIQSIDSIIERTTPGTYKIHVLDNESSPETQAVLLKYLNEKKIESVTLHNTNTRCLWGKLVFQAMSCSDDKYYVVTDNDILPPKTSPDWLSQMVTLMDKKTDIAFLTPQLPPQGLQMPFAKDDDVVYCKAVGNTFKMVRRESYPWDKYNQNMESFGDDGLVSELVAEKGWKVAFCRNLYCWHSGQTTNWGYKPEDLSKDPRKAGYGEPYKYTPENMDTFLPPPELRL